MISIFNFPEKDKSSLKLPRSLTNGATILSLNKRSFLIFINRQLTFHIIQKNKAEIDREGLLFFFPLLSLKGLSVRMFVCPSVQCLSEQSYASRINSASGPH